MLPTEDASSVPGIGSTSWRSVSLPPLSPPVTGQTVPQRYGPGQQPNEQRLFHSSQIFPTVLLPQLLRAALTDPDSSGRPPSPAPSPTLLAHTSSAAVTLVQSYVSASSLTVTSWEQEAVSFLSASPAQQNAWRLKVCD